MARDVLLSGVGRAAWSQNIWTPDENGHFRLQLYFPKEDAQLKAMEESTQAVLMEFFKGKPPADAFWPFTDGNAKNDPNAHGMICCTFKSKFRPAVLTTEADPITGQWRQITQESGEWYDGCFARVSYHCYAFRNKTSGVAFGLNNIQKIGDADPFYTPRSPDEDFNDAPF